MNNFSPRRVVTTISIPGNMAWKIICFWRRARAMAYPWPRETDRAPAKENPPMPWACSEEIFANLMSASISTSPAQPNASGALAIRVENLCRHYRMGETLIRAVDGVSLQVSAGEFVALLGSSGSGKSSVLNLIAGLDRPTSGSVIVQDRDLAKLSREELAKYRLHVVGMVFQSFNLIASMTLAENVELPLRFAEVDRGKRGALAKAALDRVGLGARMHHRPSELSGGEQQRAALARALINRPQLLLADEPTGNLDSHTGTEIMDMVREFNQQMGMTVVMVTHERALAERYAQRMIFLADGKLVDDRTNAPSGGSRENSRPG